MNPTRVFLRTGSLTAVLAVAFFSSAASAADCSSLSNPVYVIGSSAVKPFLGKVAAELAAQSTAVTVVAQLPGSCLGINALVAATPTKMTGTAIVWSSAGVEGTCDLGLTGQTAVIGVSDVFAESCPGVTALPAGIKDFFGPIQSMTFVAPLTSSQSSISAEAAYLTFGFGTAGEVAPFNDITRILIRSETSGTQQMLAEAIGVPASKWKGVTHGKGGELLSDLTGPASTGKQDQTIGILATDVTDKNRATVKTLAYQHYDQSCGYLPDSDATSFDKQNVRDGHYMVWGPLHMLTPVTAGVPTNVNAKLVIDYLTGAKAPTAFDMINLEATNGVIPECAMRVRRQTEVGPLASFMPEKSCECKFVKEATGTAPSTCKVCVKDADCTASAPSCNYGFCEVK